MALPGVLVAVFAVLAMQWLWPLWTSGRAPGARSGEAAAHIWGLVVASDGLTTHGPFLRVADAALPAGIRRDLLDPVSLLVFTPVLRLTGSPAAAWGALGLSWMGVLAGGGVALGQRMGLGRLGTGVLAAALLCAPYWQGGLLLMGRSEYWPWALWPLHLAMLHDGLHAETGRARLWGALWAALTLTMLAHGGWQPLVYVLPVQCCVALGMAWTAPRWRAVGTLVAVAIGAALLTLPMLWAHLETAPWWLARVQGPPGSGVPLETPISSLLGTGQLLHGDVAPFVGWALPLLAVVGAWRVRRARPWALLGLVVVALALGPRIRVTEDLLLLGPFGMLPGNGRVHGVGRAIALATVPLGVAAALLVNTLSRRWAMIAVGLVVLEGVVWRPLPNDGVPVHGNAQVKDLYNAVPDANVAVFWTVTEPTDVALDEALLQSRGRGTSLSPAPRDDAPLRAISVLFQPPARTDPRDHPCAGDDAARLWWAGFQAVLLLHTTDALVPRRRRRVAQATDLLGTPALTNDQGAIWALAPQPPPTHCPTVWAASTGGVR